MTARATEDGPFQKDCLASSISQPALYASVATMTTRKFGGGMDDDYSRSIRMHCSTCGSTDFEFEDEAGPIRCTSCDRVFTREELIRENGEVIEAEVDEMKSEIVRDMERYARDSLRKALRGSKFIKIK